MFVNYISIFIVIATRWKNRSSANLGVWNCRYQLSAFKQPARGYMEIVLRRNRATLTNILNAKLAANSVIHFNEWRGYQNLLQHVPACILHNTVNHTYNFVDPNTGAHTQISKSGEVSGL